MAKQKVEHLDVNEHSKKTHAQLDREPLDTPEQVRMTEEFEKYSGMSGLLDFYREECGLVVYNRAIPDFQVIHKSYSCIK